MYRQFNISIFIIVLWFPSCHRTNNIKNHNTFEEAEISTVEKQENEIADSLRFDKILAEALNISIQNIDKDTFLKEYEINLENGSSVKVQINLDYHFTKSYPQLIIHRYAIGDVYIDIYLKNDNKFQKILSHKEWSLTYINDTIQDVNGDSYKDLVINGYGSSGCCLKAYSLVYLFRTDSLSFSDCYDFLNPTFSSEERTIRGICYGHPGETEMYKYQWNGEKVDTVEYVYYEKNSENQKTGIVIVSNSPPYTDKHTIVKRLKSVPAEYHTIDGYDWFTGEGYY